MSHRGSDVPRASSGILETGHVALATSTSTSEGAGAAAMTTGGKTGSEDGLLLQRSRRPSLGADGIRRGPEGDPSVAAETVTAAMTAPKKRAKSSGDGEDVVVTPFSACAPAKKKAKHAAPDRQALLGRLEDTVRTPRTGIAENPDEGRGEVDPDDDGALDGPKEGPTTSTMTTTTKTDGGTKVDRLWEAEAAERAALVEAAHKCFREHDATMGERDRLRAEAQEARDEVERLRSADELSRKTIANLIRSKESALAQARAATAAKSHDGALRAELSVLAVKYEASESDLHEAQRKAVLLRGELDHARALLTKCKSDKAKLEREKRMAAATAATWAAPSTGEGAATTAGIGVDSGADKAAELEHYKAKVSDLHMKLNRMGAVMEEKDRQLDEMRRQLDRSALLDHHHDHASSSATAVGRGGNARKTH